MHYGIEGLKGINVLFIAGFGPITRTPADSAGFYRDQLGLPLKPLGKNQDYLMTEHNELEGVKHFALWPLDQAAVSCFGTDRWPDDVAIPQAWVEFEVADIVSATDALVQNGHRLLVNNRLEPWGQTVTRLLSPEGLLVGLSITPWLREA